MEISYTASKSVLHTSYRDCYIFARALLGRWIREGDDREPGPVHVCDNHLVRSSRGSIMERSGMGCSS